jgi:hypothetical protein
LENQLVRRPGNPNWVGRSGNPARPMLDGLRKQLTRLGETVTGVKQAIDLRFVLGLLLNLVEVALIRNRRVRVFVLLWRRKTARHNSNPRRVRGWRLRPAA